MSVRLAKLPTVGKAAGLIDIVASGVEQALRDGSRPHFLVVGGPGTGKRHTLDAVTNRLAEREVPALVLRPAGYGIGNYADLLFEALRTHSPRQAHAVTRDELASIHFEELIGDIAEGRPVVLVLDRVDRIFNNLDRGAQGSLRAWVETSGNVALLASAEEMTEPLSRRTWPWFGSFNVMRLEPFAFDDAVSLVLFAADGGGRADVREWIETGSGPEQLANLYDQLGGNARVWSLAAAILAHSGPNHQLAPAVLDQLTPYVLPRLNQLSNFAARLVIALARSRIPKTVTDLAAELGVTNQNAAATLSRLKSTGWVVGQKRPGADGRTTFYSVADPLIVEFVRTRDRPHA
jgi:hypothetical protein